MTDSGKVERLGDMREEVAAQLRARANIYRVSQRINYTADDAAIDELAAEVLVQKGPA